MLIQTIKAWTLFLSCLFTIIAISDYFGSGKSYAPLIATAFIIYLIGEVTILVVGWRHERRKLDLTGEDRLPWMWKRQAD